MMLRRAAPRDGNCKEEQRSGSREETMQSREALAGGPQAPSKSLHFRAIKARGGVGRVV